MCVQCTCDYTFSNPPLLPKIKLESFLITLSNSLSISRYLTLFAQWQHVSLTLMSTESLKLSNFLVQNCDVVLDVVAGTQGLRALSGVVLQISPPLLHVFIFLLSGLRGTARARMFLICSRSFSLSRPACLPALRPLLSRSQKWKKESLSPHLFFPREKSRFVLFTVAVVVVVLGSVVWSSSSSSWGHSCSGSGLRLLW